LDHIVGSRNRGQSRDQRAVVAAATHLQRAPVPAQRKIHFELEIRRCGILRPDDPDDLAENAVGIPGSEAATTAAVWTTAPEVGRPIADAGME
jgi:hypothetical protein